MSGFWIFMFLMTLLVSLTMIIFGLLFYYKPPKEINGVYGYRTSMSRKNRQTWEFAHRYCGKLWVLAGNAMLPFAAMGMFFVRYADVDTIGTWGGILVLVQCIVLVLTIPLTERALRKNFDKNGIKKEQ